MRSAFGLPSLSEEGILLNQEVDSKLRLAVIIKRGNYQYEVPAQGFGDVLGPEIAATAKELFGTDSVGLSHSLGGDWSKELLRAGRAHAKSGTSLPSQVEHARFMQQQGYDLYVEVITKPERQMYETYVLGRGPTQGQAGPYIRFTPFFRVFKLQTSGEILPLVRTGPESTIGCDLVSPDGRDPQADPYAVISNPMHCAKEIGLIFKSEIAERLRAAR